MPGARVIGTISPGPAPGGRIVRTGAALDVHLTLRDLAAASGQTPEALARAVATAPPAADP